MHPDHRDPLHDSRNAMTEWERSLRPVRERHWAMWIALSALLLFGLYRGAEWLLAQRVARPVGVKSTPPPVPGAAESPRRVPSRPAANPSGGSSTTSTTVEVSKCTGAAGQTAYSDGPCPEGSTATTVRVDRNLNLADGMSAEAREASNRNSAALAAQQQSHERQVARNTASDTRAECDALDAHVKWIDTMARQPQGAAMQDWLRNDRQQARDQRFRLGCR
jgi:cytoskeletal protein RodZ